MTPAGRGKRILQFGLAAAGLLIAIAAAQSDAGLGMVAGVDRLSAAGQPLDSRTAQAEPRTNAPAAPASKTITIGFIGGEVLNYGPILAAKSGFGEAAQKFGMNIEYQSFGTGVNALAALFSGSLDWIGSGANEVLKTSAARRDVVGVFNLYQGGSVILVGAKKYEAERGRDIRKYAGSTWAYTREGTLSQGFMQAVAEAGGLKWAELNRVTLGSVTGFLPSLQSGRADIVAMDATAAAKAVGVGFGYVVANTNDRAFGEPIWGDQIGSVLATTRKFLTAYPELSAALVEAQLKGFLELRAAGEDWSKALGLMPEDFRTKSSDYFDKQWALMMPAFKAVDGTFAPKAIEDTVKLMHGIGMLQPDDRFDPATFDNSLTEAAYKVLAQPKPPIQ